MEIIKTRLEMSEAECPECGTTLRYWPSEVKTEVIDRYIYRYPLKVPVYDYGSRIERMIKKASIPVESITKDGIVFRYASATSAAKILSCSQGNICEAVNGKRKTACGMSRRKVDE